MYRRYVLGIIASLEIHSTSPEDFLVQLSTYIDTAKNDGYCNISWKIIAEDGRVVAKIYGHRLETDYEYEKRMRSCP